MILAALFSGLSIAIMLKVQGEKEVRSNTLSLLRLAAENNTHHSDKAAMTAQISENCRGYRITLIGAAGDVIADSQLGSQDMENHLNRPEVENAFRWGFSSAKRYSETTGTHYLYVAVKTDDDMVIRAAAPLNSLADTLGGMMPYLLMGMAAAILAALPAAKKLSEAALAPIERVVDEISHMQAGGGGRLNAPIYDELTPLVASFNTLTEKVEDSLHNLEKEKEKLEFLLDSMQQGLVVVDKQLRVLHYNNAVISLLGSKDVEAGQPLYALTHNSSITQAIESCMERQSAAVFDLELGGSVYQVAVSYLSSQWIPSGVMLLLTDKTQQYLSQKIKREFFANASHELKTPITSIKGFAELLSTGLVEDKEKQQEYTRTILKEAGQMAVLIEDILRLSSLEEGQAGSTVQVDLFEQAEQVCQVLIPQAESANISINLRGSPVSVQAQEEHMRQLLTNIIENSVKYNKPNGSVDITITKSGKNAKVVVSDTGIGIPSKDLNRVFERFYRVDRGRSRKIGGTGLGLSIVKHIVSTYEGEISVKSKPGSGTEMTVILPLGSK